MVDTFSRTAIDEFALRLAQYVTGTIEVIDAQRPFIRVTYPGVGRYELQFGFGGNGLPRARYRYTPLISDDGDGSGGSSTSVWGPPDGDAPDRDIGAERRTSLRAMLMDWFVSQIAPEHRTS